MIRYVIRSYKNPRSGQVKLYPQIAPTTPVLRKQVIQRIEKTCTLTSSDIKACLDALEDVIVDLLTQGCTVRLGDLGSFRPTLAAEGTTDPEECTAALIRRVRVKFCPSGSMNLRVVKGAVNFAPYKSLEVQSTGA
ncbi:MAG: HU family DNA-binding protein [Bacteroidales bacterium]|nr:HU family DNA-binding protein [Bacteroidales bacterium]